MRVFFNRIPLRNGTAILNACQAFAIPEGISTDGSHRVGNGNACQACATGERIVSDGSHGVGNGNACQAVAIGERPPTDGSHGVGNTVFLHRFVARITNQCCLSFIKKYTVNRRKILIVCIHSDIG